MTTQEKAKELIERFENGLTVKDCALIAVDEIIDQWEYICPYSRWNG
jgi:hypothetical protein